MTDLRLRVLGDLEVLRDGTVLDLPPSRKTRGLLAYLALNNRPMRREQLCELLWEIPDDPRGSLRWSLSKIRKLVDDADHPRIIADRSTVAFDVRDVTIDVQNLHELAENGLETTPTEVLEEVARGYQGCFLEGLDLPNFNDFYTWCIGEREHATRSQSALLSALVERLEDTPEKALDYASRWVALQPYDEPARAGLIRLLVQLDRKQEAEQQYRSGLQKLKEYGIDEAPLLQRAWRGPPGVAPSGPVSARVPAPPVERPRLPPDRTLVGRDKEMELIADLVTALPDSSRARVVFIRGEPGLGKSRLLQATAALAREVGAGVLKAAAFESEQIRPFAAWNDALRRALPDNPTSALLGSGERVSRDQVYASLSEVVTEFTAQRPVVVLFDDVQWCDESSAGAMHYVMRMNRHQPLLVVAAAREMELRANTAVQQCIRGLRQDRQLDELRLEPLSLEATCKLIHQYARDVDAERLAEECGGNPLLAVELARAVQDGGSGHSLAELVQDRMSRLDEDASEVLLWAAVLAPRISVKSLEEVTGLDRGTIDRAIAVAEQQGILHPGERGFRFSHDLIARSIYQEIPPARQQVMHRRVAELLEVDAAVDLDLAADLAYHAILGGDAALAGRAMVSAARLCLRFFANDQALALYEQGLKFAAELGEAERICLTLELCEIRQSAAPLEDWESAVEEYVQLAERALDHGALPHARLGYQLASYLRWAHGHPSDARRDSLQAERVTRAADDQAHILGMAEAAKCLAMLERDLSQADAMAMEASALAQRCNIPCAAVHQSLGILRYYEARLEEAIDHLQDARTLYKAQGDRVNEFLSNEYLTLLEIDRGDYRAARSRCRNLIEIGSRLRDGSERPFALALEALCRYAIDGDNSTLEESLQELRQLDAKQRATVVLNRAAMLDLAGGRLESAESRAREALELSKLMQRPTEILLAHTTLAEIQRRANNHRQAEQHLDAVEELSGGAVARWARDRAAPLLAD